MVEIIEVRDMPPRLNRDCDSGWEKVSWPDRANTMLCKFHGRGGLIVGANVDGWSTPRGRSGWYLGVYGGGEPINLEVLRVRKLYFANVTDNVTSPVRIARLITKKLRRDRRA